jgi:hypothetical protein
MKGGFFKELAEGWVLSSRAEWMRGRGAMGEYRFMKLMKLKKREIL